MRNTEVCDEILNGTRFFCGAEVNNIAKQASKMTVCSAQNDVDESTCQDFAKYVENAGAERVGMGKYPSEEREGHPRKVVV